jgi:P27 family predicted phage terminase small subunit
MRGRKPVPTVLANLRGNPSHGRKPNPAEPKPVGDLAAAPDHFSDEQRGIWEYALAHAPPGMLKRIDLAPLAAWCIAFDLHRQALVAYNLTSELTVTSPKGDVMSPYLAIINRQALIMIRASSELGFSPTSRPRVFVAPTAGEGFNASASIPSATQRKSLDDYLAESAAIN